MNDQFLNLLEEKIFKIPGMTLENESVVQICPIFRCPKKQEVWDFEDNTTIEVIKSCKLFIKFMSHDGKTDDVNGKAFISFLRTNKLPFSKCPGYRKIYLNALYAKKIIELMSSK